MIVVRETGDRPDLERRREQYRQAYPESHFYVGTLIWSDRRGDIIGRHAIVEDRPEPTVDVAQAVVS